MAYTPDRAPEPRGYDPLPPPTYPPTVPAYNELHRERRLDREPAREFREEVSREVTAGPYRFGVREGVLGILGIFTVLGIVLGILGFAAAFALDNAAVELNDGDGGNTADDAAARASLLPAVLVSLLPFMAAPVLAIGCGAWAGHASRNASMGAIAGGFGAFVGPIVMLLITGVGFALGAGATNLNLAALDFVTGVNGWGIAPGWASTIPYLFTGAGLLWLVANTIGGALTGGVVGGILDHRWTARGRDERYRRSTRPPTRY